MDPEDWRDLHELTSYLFVAVVVHLAMHWSWIKVLAAQYFWATTFVATARSCVSGTNDMVCPG